MLVQMEGKHPLILSSVISPEDYKGKEEVVVRSCSPVATEDFEAGLFVCLNEDAARAREEVAVAMVNGAVAAVLTRGVLTTEEIAADARLFEVSDPRDTWGRVCEALLDYPSKKMKMIAVTGTAGKTSLSYTIAGMLAESGSHVGLLGSLGTYDGRMLCPETEQATTPESLAKALARMVDNGCDYAIVEVSSVALDQNRLAGLKFDAVCLTNIRRDHLDYHHTVDAYRRAKLRIFDYTSEKTLVVCNTDDRVTDAILHLISCPTITVGMHPTDSLVSGMLIEQNDGGQTFYIVAGIDAVPVHTRMIGKEHLYNCLLAAALGMSLGIDLKTIVPGIERVEHVPGRLEQLDCGQPYNVFVDNAATPDSLEASLEAVKAVTTGRLFCLLETHSAEDSSKGISFARVADEYADAIVLTTANLQPEATDKEYAAIRKSLGSSSREFQFIARRKDAMNWVLSEARPDDSVLIIGSDSPGLSDSNGASVSDRQYVRAWLYENQPCMEPFWF
ncbi:MAG: UDP-N-acetylmuramyl-tripeptide synthetase [Planctomycetia bacterium]|nr:UDP-N-acetylmuramyl-tripeptide synthetase [Planctomycetia bacterium]